MVSIFDYNQSIGRRKLTAVHRKFGEYWRRRDARSIASGGIRLWKICNSKIIQLKLCIITSSNKHNLINKYFTYLVPWMGFDLREFKFCVAGIHAANFLMCWSTKNLKQKQIHSAHENKY
jgi:hypothetical protein